VIIRSITAPNPGPFTLDGTQTYLLGENAVLDPGPAIDSHVDAIRAAMPRLRTILITHRHADHAPAAAPLKAATGARVIAPRGVPGEVDQRVSGGELIDVGSQSVEVIATPGHTNEHVCYLTSDGDLFTGDTVLGAGTTTIFPPDGNMRDYIESLRLLRSRSPKRIFPAHGPVRKDAIALLDEYIAHRLDRERQVLAALERGPAALEDLRRSIYPDLDPRLHRAAEIQLTAHLIKLESENRVAADGGAYALTEKGRS
jgi:glyoxylase-like metal-dependent hydrolase (beta-lactamase superfamily II)